MDWKTVCACARLLENLHAVRNEATALQLDDIASQVTTIIDHVTNLDINKIECRPLGLPRLDENWQKFIDSIK